MELIIHTDGGARGNPGPSAVGVVIDSPTERLASLGLFIGIGTNNQAEYKAVVTALTWIKQNLKESTSLTFLLDSELVVKQLNGIYKLKAPEMIRLKNEIDKLIADINPTHVEFSHIPRAKNFAADTLVNQALDAALLRT